MDDGATGGFAIHDVKCPSCGGPLQLPDGAMTLTCRFCGSTVHVSYGAENRQSGIEPDGTIRDRGTGYGLFRARIAEGWQVVGTSLQGTGSSSRPHIPHVELRNQAGCFASIAMGEAGTRRSAGMNAVMGMYGSQTIGADRANYADMPDPVALADMVVNSAAAGMGAAGTKLDRQLGCPNLETVKQRGLERFQRIAQAQGAHVASPFAAVVLRVYDCSVGGQPWKAAVYVAETAVKDGLGLGEGLGGLADGIGGLIGGIGNLFGGQAAQGQAQAAQAPAQGAGQGESAMDFFLGGGLLGKMKRDRQAAQMQQASQPQQAPVQAAQPVQSQAPVQEQMPQAASNGWSSPDFAGYAQGGTIYWSVDAVATLVAPAPEFDAALSAMFLPLVDSLNVHPDVENLALQVAMQEAAQIGQSTSAQLAQNQAAFNAQQAAHRQQQAAFNAYNDSISASRDARQSQFMAASHAQAGHAAPDFSEAIRGVNTYTTSDGREVELSVHADHAYENQAGDVIGTSGGFDPGANWTEIPRT